MKPLEFVGDSLECLRQFPQEARRQAGFQLDRVQRGLEPYDWKPMSAVGAGVREIRVRDVYVLHCFGKKTQATRKSDLELAEKRYRELMKEQK